jgi:hypothetical protein
MEEEMKVQVYYITEYKGLNGRKYEGTRILATSWADAENKVKIHNKTSLKKLKLVGVFVDEVV